MTTTTTPPTDLRQQPGVCPECKGTRILYNDTRPVDCDVCEGTGQQPAQPGSGEVVDTKLIHEHAEGLRHNALIFRDNNQRSRERQLYAAALAINIAGDEIDRLRAELTAAQQRIAAFGQQPAAVDEAMVFRLAVWMAKHDGHDDPHHLIWEGSPPEPWGEVWNRYEDDARAALTATLRDRPREALTEATDILKHCLGDNAAWDGRRHDFIEAQDLTWRTT